MLRRLRNTSQDTRALRGQDCPILYKNIGQLHNYRISNLDLPCVDGIVEFDAKQRAGGKLQLWVRSRRLGLRTR